VEIDVLSAGAHGGPRVFDSADVPADAATLERLRRGTAGVDLAAPAVVLPDFHHTSRSRRRRRSGRRSPARR
jgi:tRNA-splicing ligase RtcB (3'-phosphate/5'-hydroxy nucleic acid ligase)